MVQLFTKKHKKHKNLHYYWQNLADLTPIFYLPQFLLFGENLKVCNHSSQSKMGVKWGVSKLYKTFGLFASIEKNFVKFRIKL